MLDSHADARHKRGSLQCAGTHGGATDNLSYAQRFRPSQSKRLRDRIGHGISSFKSKAPVAPRPAASSSETGPWTPQQEAARAEILADAASSSVSGPVQVKHTRSSDAAASYALKHDSSGNVRVLGKGASCQVTVATRLADGKRVAVKQVDFATRADEIATELACLRRLDHPHIVRLHEAFAHPDAPHVSLVLEHLAGGDLFDHLTTSTRLSERESARLVQQMLRAVRYMHAQGVVHRDLKLENFAFRDKDRAELVLIDFGLGAQLQRGDPKLTRCVGTSYYVSPEAIRKSYDGSCDVWAVGVLSYMLLSGKMPFRGSTDVEVMTQILAQQPPFTSAVWRTVSPLGRTFIDAMLCKDPTHRLSVDEALAHPWLFRYGAKPPSRTHREAAARRLLGRARAFAARPALQRLALFAIAHDLPSEQVATAERDFACLDGTALLGQLFAEGLARDATGRGKSDLSRDAWDAVVADARSAVAVLTGCGAGGLARSSCAGIERTAVVAAYLHPEDFVKDDGELARAFATLCGHGADALTADALRTALGGDPHPVEIAAVLDEARKLARCEPGAPLSLDDLRAVFAEAARDEERESDTVTEEKSTASCDETVEGAPQFQFRGAEPVLDGKDDVQRSLKLLRLHSIPRAAAVSTTAS